MSENLSDADRGRTIKPDGRYAHLKGKFPLVYWITGGSCSRKSSIADRLAQAHGLQVIHTDDLGSGPIGQIDLESYPITARLLPTFLKGFLHWMRIPVIQSCEMKYEIFGLLLNKVETFGPRPIVVEGMIISIAAVAEVSSLDRIVCLTGTDNFLRTQERQHPYVLEHYDTWDDPEQTLAALIEGHIRITHQNCREVKNYGIRHIVTDKETKFEDKLKQIEEHFGLL